MLGRLFKPGRNTRPGLPNLPELLIWPGLVWPGLSLVWLSLACCDHWAFEGPSDYLYALCFPHLFAPISNGAFNLTCSEILSKFI